jgi:signal transduction histidine kinase
MSVLTRNVRNKLFLAFAVLTTVLSFWSLSFFLEKIWTGGTFYWWHLLLHSWIGPAALVFIRLMVRLQDRASRRLLDLSVALSLSLTSALVLHLDAIDWVRTLLYFSPALVGLQILRLMWVDRARPHLPAVGFGRRNWIFFGGLLALCTSSMDHVAWLGLGVPAFGNLALTVYIFFVSQAITQQRLLNFGALVSRFLVLLGVALILTGMYSVFVAWISDSPELFFLNSFIASFFILTLLDPLRTMVGYLTERMLSQKHLRLQNSLREAQRRLAGVVDATSLFQAILQFTEQTLSPQWAGLFVLRSDGTRFRRVRTVSQVGRLEPELAPATGALREILANHPLFEYSERLQKKGELPIVLDQIIANEIDRSASRPQREHLAGLIEGLNALGANLVIPLFHSGSILGFLALSIPEPPEPWGSNWGLLRVIYPFFEQAGQALQSMEVFVRSREKERLAALGEMAAGLAHEIRNPLGAIKGAAQFLDPDADRPDSRFLRVIVEEVDRLNRVVTQFLDYSKPSTSDLKPVELIPLTERTIDNLRPSIREGVELSFSRPAEPVSVMGSPEQLQQVLINLLQNAAKALDGRTEGGRVRVTLELEGSAAQPEVALTVEDNGRGIKREHMDKLFIPFFTTSPSGTGLGLPISQKIIEAHRGRIEFASEEGRFTRFSVVLPVLPKGGAAP